MSLGWWGELDWWSDWTSCVVSGRMALPSPEPPTRHRSAAGCPARTGPDCRTANTPRTHSGEWRWPATSSPERASNYWKSCSVSGDSWRERTVCRSEPRSVLPRRPPPPRYCRSPLAPRRSRRSCSSLPAVSSPDPEANYPVGSLCQNIWSWARLRSPGSKCTKPQAIPALARLGGTKWTGRTHLKVRTYTFTL